ncbi:MAG: DNA internalization-related competence protein ComEC/Rec2 [uncultured Corynebacteriales bacterium]|uniref:DNA internalization-related competence protein ComEC/Rec2 n=1 Tax=uncultured Mycobacteriales bacterium TaxID=581187 RepID=A0A6J4I9A9_9ACTN|nr:MAG: DNA internalization-related competence protein ComEC/Rec2 [uncultured Corynebacteriales bacterium]
MSEPVTENPPADLRLAVGGVAAWLSVLATLGLRSGTGLAVAAAALLGAVVALAGRRRWSAAAALVLGCAGAAALATAVRVGTVERSPVTVLAAQRAVATMDLVLTDDPRRLRVTAGPPRVLVEARAERVVAAGRSWSLSGTVLVIAPADGWVDLLPSQRVRAAGRLGPPSRDDLTLAVLSARSAPVTVGPPSTAHTAAGNIREGLRDAASVLPEGPRGLLPGLVVGDVSGMDPGLTDDFRTAGLSHLTAVSGTNVAIVTGAVLLLLRRVTAGPRLSAVLAALALAGFVLLARPSPSVLRAAVMGGIALVALASGRPRSALPALGAAVLILVFVSPPLARDPGFALSVLATAGLVLLGPGWAAWLRARRVPPGAAEALAVPAAATVATAPVVAAISGTVSLVSIPANLLAAPAVAPATVLGVLAAVVSPVSSTAAEWLVRAAGVPVGWLVGVGTRAARVPGAAAPWPGGTAGAFLLVGALILAAVAARHRAVRRILLAVLVGAVLVFLPVRTLAPGWPPPGWIFVACSVGQGDALAVRTGPGAAMVVDAGPDPAAVDSCLRDLGVRAVPTVLLSHLHADHVDGLAGVLRGRSVGELEVGASRDPPGAWREVEETARRFGVPVRTVAAGERRQVGGLMVDVLGPGRAFRGTRSDPNNSSVVVRVGTGGRTLLLGGDIETEAQDALVRSGVDLRADVLKIPHHGSAYGSPEFLRAARASVAVVSVGRDNDYGHPSPRLLRELDRLGVRTLRTDLDGDVAVVERDGRLAVVTRPREPP